MVSISLLTYGPSVPFVSRFCPSDVYKIWKKGSYVRVDTTLKGFDKLKWVRGNISFIYQATVGEMGNLYILDHDRKVFEHVKSEDREEKIEERTNIFMNSKIHYGDFNSTGIKFERMKTGAFGILFLFSTAPLALSLFPSSV